MAQVGRISGPLLEANLERNGIDLAFRNDLDTTQLLFLDVNNGRIGVNTATPTRDLDVNGTLQTVNLLAGDSRISGFDIANSTFSAIGNIELNAAEAVVLPALDNGTFFIDGNYISTSQSNASIDLTPNGAGEVQIINDLNVYGNLYTPGNITLDGSITFGNEDTDAVDFNADVNSDIIPDQTSTYSLGSTTKRWQTLYTNLLNGQAVSVDELTIGLIDYKKSQGNIIYVAQNGADTNRGDHILAPVASIKRALELVDASVGSPTVVLVFPGDYEEETPLVIPSNVSVIGTDIRNTSVFPTSYTLSEDVFHLNGETTVANLTIKNFYYDSNKGYAFRFAPNAVISTRSPYVQNITVITKGSTTTVDDPRGFDSGDAGRGAYIDGAEINPASIDASMLFHSCTFITPGVDAIVMTNGVRVEWLNSFTYFANRGLYAFNNSTGRVSNDGSTINYGAEVRSIGSANVYGNYGAVADGADTLMYLIQHNFAYIGSGKDSSNDEGLVVQANEVVEENSGQIHYVTTDHTGAFRIGDNFFVDFKSGSTSVDLSTLTANSLNGLAVTTGADQTFITGSNIETGNIRISDNIIQSLVDELNIDAATNEINFNNNTNVSNNLSIDGNLSFGGNLNLLGNQTSDTLKFNVDFDQNFNPNQTLRFSLGIPSKQWLMAHLSEINVGDIKIYDNVIETKTSNADLELRANGTGNVSIPNNNVSISNSLTVDQTSSFDNVTVSGPVSVTATMTLNNDVSARNVNVGQSISIDQQATFEGIVIDDNYISTIASNADLELRASGTGSIVVPNNNVRIQNSLSAADIDTSSNVDITLQTEFNQADVSLVRITQNRITTNESNADLELRASGAGSTSITLAVAGGNGGISPGFTSGSSSSAGGGAGGYSGNGGNGATPGSNLGQSGTGGGGGGGYSRTTIDPGAGGGGAGGGVGLLGEGASGARGGFSSPGGKGGSGGTDGGSYGGSGGLFGGGGGSTNLIYQTSGGGGGLRYVNNIPVSSGQTYTLTIGAGGIATAVSGAGGSGGMRIIWGEERAYPSTNTADVGDQQVIYDTPGVYEWTVPSGVTSICVVCVGGGSSGWGGTDGGNTSFDNIFFAEGGKTPLTQKGTGIGGGGSTEATVVIGGGTVEIVVPNNNVQIDNNLTIAGNTSLQSTTITGTLTHTGTRTQTGNYSQTGNLSMTGVLDVASAVQLENININDNVITTTQSNSDLELRASGSGDVLFPNNTVRINNNLFAASIIAGNINVDTDLVLNELIIPPSIIEIDDNFISTRVSNADLELRATGNVTVLTNDVTVEQNLTVTLATSLKNTQIVGAISHTGSTTQVGNKIQVGNLAVSGITNFTSSVAFEDIQIIGNVLTTTQSNSILELNANGTGTVLIDNNNVVVNQDLSVGSLSSSNIIINNSFALELMESSTDVQIFDNVITTTNSNSNLELKTAGSGDIVLENLYVNTNTISTPSDDIILSTPNLNINSTGSLQIPVGSSELAAQGEIKFDSTTGLFEGRNNSVVTLSGVYSSDRRTRLTAHPTNNTLSLTVNNVVVGTVAAAGLTIHGLQVDDIGFQTNTVSTTVSNSNLELVTPGIGELVIDDISIIDNTIKNNSSGALTFATTGLGRVKFNDTNGLVIPYGTTAEQPIADPELGDTRWNTDTALLETWDGNQYVTSAGVATAISEQEYNDLLLEYTLIFG